MSLCPNHLHLIMRTNICYSNLLYAVPSTLVQHACCPLAVMNTGYFATAPHLVNTGSGEIQNFRQPVLSQIHIFHSVLVQEVIDSNQLC